MRHTHDYKRHGVVDLYAALEVATGNIVHETGSMVFVRGHIYSGERTILNFSGVLKKLKPRK